MISYSMHTVDALGLYADEGRERQRYTSVRCLKTFDPAVSEWDNPSFRMSSSEYIGRVKVLPELKHLSRGRKRNQRDCVSKR